MIPTLTRRSFIATTALTAASLGLPRGAWTATHPPLLLSATSRTLDIDGRANGQAFATRHGRAVQH